jgi:hypothetical protein
VRGQQRARDQWQASTMKSTWGLSQAGVQSFAHFASAASSEPTTSRTNALLCSQSTLANAAAAKL